MKGINWLGVIVALIAGQAIGFLWYGMVFTETWMQLKGVTEADAAATQTTSMAYGAVNQLVVAVGLGWAVAALGRQSWMGGAQVGLFAAIFFAATTLAQNFIYGMENTGLIPIEGGYLLVSYLVMGAIVGGLRLKSKSAEPAAA
jgi:hypothetical protein